MNILEAKIKSNQSRVGLMLQQPTFDSSITDRLLAEIKFLQSLLDVNPEKGAKLQIFGNTIVIK